jgi:hypothetical protein
MFAEALGRMGLQAEEAEQLALACGLSVTILQRLRAPANFDRPRWADGQTVVPLLPAILASRWNDRSEADRQVLCRLAGSPDYDDVVGGLQEFLSVDEPPLQRIDELWTLTAPVDAFHLMARRLTGVLLERFKEAFREVFGAIDPKVEISPDEWLYLDIKGEQGHSAWLRSGMAEILLLIAERGTEAQLRCGTSPHTYAEEVIRGLPGLNADWRILASLRDVYPLLIEAAPRPFLSSLEHLLEARPDDLRRLFVEGERFGSGSMHTGLLWGLETLAWSSEYLPEVALLLARLARIDPGGRLANRPINSLGEIFLWWSPGTNATFDQRIAALDLILDREPEVGWELVAMLLPRATSSVSSPNAKPRWRDFGDLPVEATSRRAQLTYVSALVDRGLERVETDPERWRHILSSLSVISTAQLEKAVTLLDSIARGSASTEVKAALWEILRDFTSRHRTFSNTHWVLPTEVLDRLEAILARMKPDDPVKRNMWLFDEWLPDLPSREEGFEHREQKAAELRQQAVEEILGSEGIGGLIRLGTTCKFPAWVANFAVPLMKDLGKVRDFVEQALATGEAGFPLASQISARAQQIYAEAWPALIFKEYKAGQWDPTVIAVLMQWWPDSRATWEDVAALGDQVQAAYWRRKHVGMIDGSVEDQIYQIDRLIEAGRAAEAFDRTALHGEHVPSDTMLRIFDATLDQLERAQTPEEVRRVGLNSYDVCQFLDQLRNRMDIPREQLARREYQALPLLGSLNAEELIIHELMAEDPNFFMDVLCHVYLPAHRDKSENIEPTAEALARARAAYTLLKGMRKIPGQRTVNEIDEAVLFQWIYAVRNRGADRDRAAIADQQIGHILAHAPTDPEDTGWPHRSIRNVVEKLAADEIDRGLMVERYNIRGIYKKNLYEGGTQERALASKYRGWANISRTRWPRMARVLAAIAEGWEEDGRREDARAEQDKLG